MVANARDDGRESPDKEEGQTSMSALSIFRANEQEIERRKMEVKEKVSLQLGRAEQETKRLSVIREVSPTLNKDSENERPYQHCICSFCNFPWIIPGVERIAISTRTDTTEIRQELEAMADPTRKEVAAVRRKIDAINRDLKPLGQNCLKKVLPSFPPPVPQQLAVKSERL